MRTMKVIQICMHEVNLLELTILLSCACMGPNSSAAGPYGVHSLLMASHIIDCTSKFKRYCVNVIACNNRNLVLCECL